MSKELKFEEALLKLEELVGKLETDEVSLEDSMKLFQEGMELSKLCTTKLDEIHEKINVLIEKDGELIIEEKMLRDKE